MATWCSGRRRRRTPRAGRQRPEAAHRRRAAIAAPISNFFVAGDAISRGGVRVAVKNVDGDNRADIVTGSGEDQFSLIRVYRGFSVGKGEPTVFQDLDPFGTVLSDGVFVG